MGKNIFIVSQRGLDPLYNQWAKEAIEELMQNLPDYKDAYPITNLGNWSSPNALISPQQLSQVPAEERGAYIKRTDGNYLVPFESTDYIMAAAKLSAYRKGRAHQIDASMILDLMEYDPTVQQIPQIAVNLVRDDAFAMQGNGVPTNFVYGLGCTDRGLVLSVRRYEDAYGDNPQYLKEVFKTIVMHEMGHVFNATFEGRHNTSDRDGYGQHCDCPDCVMLTESVSGSEGLTRKRLKNEYLGKSAFCPECVSSMEVMLASRSGNEYAMNKAVINFNRIVDQQRRRR